MNAFTGKCRWDVQIYENEKEDSRMNKSKAHLSLGKLIYQPREDSVCLSPETTARVDLDHCFQRLDHGYNIP